MVGHGGSSAGSYLAGPTSPIPSHCASIVVTSTVRVNMLLLFVCCCCLLMMFVIQVRIIMNNDTNNAPPPPPSTTPTAETLALAADASQTLLTTTTTHLLHPLRHCLLGDRTSFRCSLFLRKHLAAYLHFTRLFFFSGDFFASCRFSSSSSTFDFLLGEGLSSSSSSVSLVYSNKNILRKYYV